MNNAMNMQRDTNAQVNRWLTQWLWGEKIRNLAEDYEAIRPSELERTLRQEVLRSLKSVSWSSVREVPPNTHCEYAVAWLLGNMMIHKIGSSTDTYASIVEDIIRAYVSHWLAG